MMISKKEIEAWDAEYEHLKWGGASEYAWIQSRLKQNSFLLDAGSGDGRYLKHFCLEYPCIAADVSEKALRRSRQNVEDAAEKKGMPAFGRPDFVLSTVTDLPFADNTFDAILCLGVLQHLRLPGRSRAACEFYRTLKTGGFLFFEAFGEADMRCGGNPVFSENGDPEPRTFERGNGILYHYFEEAEIRMLFEGAGFSIPEMKSLQKEKKYAGKTYIRHHYRAVFEKI